MEEQTNLSPEQNQEEQPTKHPCNHVSDSFKELPMGSIIGGPLRAAAEKQRELANSVEEFYKK